MLQLYEGKKAFFGGDAVSAVNYLTEANSYFKSLKLRLALLLLRAAPQLLLRAYNLRDRITIGMSTRF